MTSEMTQRQIDRFWSRVDRRDNERCWIFEHAAASSNGYGRFSLNGRTVMAHRIAYELVKGPIPPGLFIDHLCMNRPCVNPDHLEPVTHTENIRRARVAYKEGKIVPRSWLRRIGGQGSIRHINDTTWRISVELPNDPSTRKRRQATRTIRGTRKDAEVALDRLKIEVGQGQHLGFDCTLAETIEAWMMVVELGHTARRDYRSAIDKHIVPRIGSLKVERLRAAHLDRFYSDLKKTGLGPARIRRVHNILSAALTQAVRWEWIARNPARDATPPEVRRTAVTAPTVDQVRAIIEKADGELVTWLRLDASLGARRGEICGLRWCDIDLEQREIRLPEAIVDGGPGIGIVRKPTKTGIVRVVAIDDGTTRALHQHRRMVLERALASGVSIPDDGYVFSRDVAGLTPWRPDSVTKQFGRICKALGYDTAITLRTLRHFVATQMLAAGVDPRTVAGRLGHAKPSTTLDIYAAFLPARDRGAADALGELLG